MLKTVTCPSTKHSPDSLRGENRVANKLWGSLESQDLALVPVPPAISLMPSLYERPGTASERWRLAPVPAALPYGDLPYMRIKGYQLCHMGPLTKSSK